MTKTPPQRLGASASSSGRDRPDAVEQPAGPAVTVQDLSGGRVRLSVRGDVSWPTALGILEQLRDPEGTLPSEAASEAPEES